MDCLPKLRKQLIITTESVVNRLIEVFFVFLKAQSSSFSSPAA